MRKNRFQKGFHSTTFNCGVCGRLTREVDQGGTELCPQCFEIAGEDNHFNDTGTTPTPEQMKHFNSLLAHIGKKGGNVERARDCNEFIWTTDTTTEEKDMSDKTQTIERIPVDLLQGMGKAELRAACKARSISYTKMTVSQMRESVQSWDEKRILANGSEHEVVLTRVQPQRILGASRDAPRTALWI